MRFFTFGNMKLPKSTAIFNMSAALNCAADLLGLCALQHSKRCYAKKAERLYPQVLAYRMSQHEFWKYCTVQEFIMQFNKEKGKRKIKYLRFNESGDFISQKCVKKAIQIAKILLRNNIKTYTVTARKDLNLKHHSPLLLTGSNFMLDNQFTVIYKGENTNGITCPGSCKTCDICRTKNGIIIHNKLH